MVFRTARPKGDPAGSGIKMTEERFKEWLKYVDRNGDGVISRQELRDAFKSLGMHFTRWKAWWAVRKADLNSNHGIDGDAEVEELVKYVRTLGIIVT